MEIPSDLESSLPEFEVAPLDVRTPPHNLWNIVQQSEDKHLSELNENEETKYARNSHQSEVSSHESEKLLIQRTQVRISEKKRRNKLNEKIQQMRDILSEEENFQPRIKKRKQTKEQVLENALHYMQQLQQEVIRLKQEKQQLSSVCYCQEELTNIYTSLILQFNTFTNNSFSLKNYTRMLGELSCKIDLPQFKIYTFLLRSMYGQMIDPNPREQLNQLKEGIEFYFSYQKKFEKPLPLIVGLNDVGIELMTESANTLLSLGYVDAAITQFEKAEEWANQLGHVPSFLSMKVKRMSEMYWVGDLLTIKEVKELQEIVKPYYHLNPLLLTCDPCVGYIIAQSCKDKEDKIAGATILENGVKDHGAVWGSTSDIHSASYILTSLAITEQYNKGLQLVERVLQRIEETGFEGRFTKADILRLKGELMFGKWKHSERDEKILKEIENILLEARNMAARSLLKSIELKCAYSLMKIYMETNNKTKLQTWKTVLACLVKHFNTANSKHKTLDVVKATELLNLV